MHSRKILITLIAFMVLGALSARAELPQDALNIVNETRADLKKTKQFASGLLSKQQADPREKKLLEASQKLRGAAKNSSYSMSQKISVENLSDALEFIAKDSQKNCKNLRSEIILQFDPSGSTEKQSSEVRAALDVLKDVCK